MAYQSKKILYLGLDPTRFALAAGELLIHYPIISILPVPFSQLENLLLGWKKYTHIICSSRTVASILVSYQPAFIDACFIAIGKATADFLKDSGASHIITAKEETAEGLVELINQLNSAQSYIFYPHSAKSRSLITDYLQKNGFCFDSLILYNTLYHHPKPIPILDEFNEIVFTSPSTIDSFLALYQSFPKNISLKTIGPITLAHLNYLLGKNSHSPMVVSKISSKIGSDSNASKIFFT